MTLKINYLDTPKGSFKNTALFLSNDTKISEFKGIFDDKINQNIDVGAGVILDASEGPILIDQYSRIDIGALIKGPVYIGQKSIINPGSRLRGNVSIGPVCKIGGEIEDVVIQGYTNKQHDGYLGHSFLGEWINVGANTNNSDLKNNYSKIKFNFSDTSTIDTKRLFLGVMIGDFCRTGISTMINTGSYFGLGSNIFGAGFQNKYIPSFNWGQNEIVDFNKFITTIKRMKARRTKKVSDSEVLFLQNLYNLKTK
mgnify:CR=1 FL=1